MSHGSYMKIGDAETSSDSAVDKPYYPPLSTIPSVAVISPKFCSPSPVELTMVRKVPSMMDGNFSITDVNGNAIFEVKNKVISGRNRRFLLDAAGNPLITLEEKMLSTHNKWKVFRGDGNMASKDLIFRVQRSSVFQMKTKLDVFLATNEKEESCDFTVKGSWSERSCTIYSGNSDNVVAQMHNKVSAASLFLGKDTFMVMVYPNVDSAFVAALIVILDAINRVGLNS